MPTSHESSVPFLGPRVGPRGHGPRVGSGARLRPWLHATNFPTLPPRARVMHYLFEPVANPTAPGSGVPTPARVRGPTAPGPRLGARLWPWLYATKFLPFAPRTRVKHLLFELVANPTAHGSRFGARLRPWRFATCSPLSQIACVLPRYPRGKLKCGLSYAIFRFSKVTIFSAKYRSITPFHAS